MTLVLTVQASTLGAEISWSPDYAQAQKQCQAEKKPMAVILGTGEKGYSQLISEGGVSKEVADLLSTSYVCFYVDTSSPKGKQVAEAFEMASGKGIVLSDRSGVYQNYWHEGTMSTKDLAARLTTYATESVSTRTSYYGAQPAAPQYQPTYQQGGSYCPSCSRGR
jgi:hypothetical protein